MCIVNFHLFGIPQRLIARKKSSDSGARWWKVPSIFRFARCYYAPDHICILAGRHGTSLCQPVRLYFKSKNSDLTKHQLTLRCTQHSPAYILRVIAQYRGKESYCLSEGTGEIFQLKNSGRLALRYCDTARLWSCIHEFEKGFHKTKGSSHALYRASCLYVLFYWILFSRKVDFPYRKNLELLNRYNQCCCGRGWLVQHCWKHWKVLVYNWYALKLLGRRKWHGEGFRERFSARRWACLDYIAGQPGWGGRRHLLLLRCFGHLLLTKKHRASRFGHIDLKTIISDRCSWFIHDYNFRRASVIFCTSRL